MDKEMLLELKKVADEYEIPSSILYKVIALTNRYVLFKSSRRVIVPEQQWDIIISTLEKTDFEDFDDKQIYYNFFQTLVGLGYEENTNIGYRYFEINVLDNGDKEKVYQIANIDPRRKKI